MKKELGSFAAAAAEDDVVVVAEAVTDAACD